MDTITMVDSNRVRTLGRSISCTCRHQCHKRFPASTQNLVESIATNPKNHQRNLNLNLVEDDTNLWCTNFVHAVSHPTSHNSSVERNRMVLCGAGGSDISAGNGVDLGGYWGRSSGTSGVFKPVCCRVLVVRSVNVVLIALLNLPSHFVRWSCWASAFDPPTFARSASLRYPDIRTHTPPTHTHASDAHMWSVTAWTCSTLSDCASSSFGPTSLFVTPLYVTVMNQRHSL